MTSFFKRILIFITVFLIQTLSANSAQILQIRSSSVLQVGDQNRSYTVKIPCLEVDPSNELAAKNLLKENFPRNSKVNLKPVGSKDGILLARVIDIDTKQELADLLTNAGLGQSKCN